MTRSGTPLGSTSAALAVALSWLLACGPKVSEPAVGGTTSSTGSTTHLGATETGPGSSSVGVTSAADGSTTGDPPEDGRYCLLDALNKDLGSDGLCDERGGNPWNTGECDTWNDDCPPGMKCQAPRRMGPATCVELPEQPVDIYGACEWDEAGLADDCDRSRICVEGICLGACQCSLDWRHCEDPNAVCAVETLDLPAYCRPLCDILDPQCPAALSECDGNATGFTCRKPGAGPGEQQVGEDCPVPQCAEGLYCLTVWDELGWHEPERVPGCDSDSQFCCVETCSRTTGGCSDPATECSPFGKIPSQVDCTGDAGVCLLPERAAGN